MLLVLRDRTIGLLDNFRRCLLTADLQRTLYNQPLWKHIYHALYWFDYWYGAPENYIGAPFHCDGLENLDLPINTQVSQSDLLAYLKAVEEKTLVYAQALTEEKLSEIPAGCGDKTRFACILGQFIHAYSHIGIVNGMMIEQTGAWTTFAIRAADQNKDLFESQ